MFESGLLRVLSVDLVRVTAAGKYTVEVKYTNGDVVLKSHGHGSDYGTAIHNAYAAGAKRFTPKYGAVTDLERALDELPQRKSFQRLKAFETYQGRGDKRRRVLTR